MSTRISLGTLLTALALVVVGAGSSAGQPGALDPSFSGGVARTSIGASFSQAAAVAIQSDGRIVAAGSVGPFEDGDIAVVRHESDGSPDASFGTGGVVVTPLSPGNDTANTVAVQADGKIVVAGESHNGTDLDVAIVRYLADGSLDASFGTAGVVITPVGGGNEKALALVLQPDDKLVIAGYTANPTDADVLLIRYDSSGALDPSFGTGGIATLDISGNSEVANALVLEPDGKLVVAGWTGPSFSGQDFMLARFDSSGNPDGGFGSSGVVTTDFSGENDQANALARQPDGKLVAAGSASSGGYSQFAVARYESNGAPDTGFSGGKATDSSGESATGVTFQSNGKLVVTGTWIFNHPIFGVFVFFSRVRLDADGTHDNTFQSGPLEIEDGGGLAAAARQADGRIVVAGFVLTTEPDLDVDFAVARLLTLESCGNGVVDPDESCDTENIPGDCCSSGCTFDSTFVSCQSDNNVCTSDHCDGAGTCVHTAVDGASCNDGDLCTTGETCTGGQCTGGTAVFADLVCGQCDPATGAPIQGPPRTGCKQTTLPGKSTLQLRDSSDDRRDKLSWSWTKGEATSILELGDPFTNLFSAHDLCLFDESGPTSTFLAGTVAEPATLLVCPRPPCWKSSGSTFTYRSSPPNLFGLSLMRLTAGPDGVAKASAKGKGDNLDMPDLPPPLPLRVQLWARDGACWEAMYSSAGVMRSDDQVFKARSD